jgi:AcrR family transcriptional regulator
VTVAERRKREREERRALILDAAERVFHEKGLHDATMDDVAAEARLGKGTLYLYFRNKDALRMGVATRHQTALLQAMAEAHADAKDGLDELRRLLAVYGRHLSSSLERLRAVFSCWVNGPQIRRDSAEAVEHLTHIRRTFSMLSNAVARGRADGTIRPGAAPPRVALELWTFVNGALLFQLQRHYMGEPEPLGQVDPTLAPPTLEEAIDACLEGVRADGGLPEWESSADSTPDPPAVRLDDEQDRQSEPRAAAGAEGSEGGATW